jgi:hypothetical protein
MSVAWEESIHCEYCGYAREDVRAAAAELGIDDPMCCDIDMTDGEGEVG